MKPEEFIEKWQHAELTERSGYQQHFLDLCHLLEVPTPAESDRKGVTYAFERHVAKASGGKGYVDVWKKDCFIWEYKGAERNLVKAHAQAREYADHLGNPPLIVVSDMKEIRVHTHFTNTVAQTYTFKPADLYDAETRRRLKLIFTDPQALRPQISTQKVTEDAAAAFAVLATKLRARKYDPRRVAHFLNKLVFCMFAEDIRLLPEEVFSDIVEESDNRPGDFGPMLADLFRAMKEDRGRFGTVPIPWVNGGLFDDDDVLPISGLEIKDLANATRLDWASIEPSIFGTLFEKGLDPQKREEMASLFDGKMPDRVDTSAGLFDRHGVDKGVGIHYTDPDTIMKIVEPVVLRPLRAEWEQTKARIEAKKRKADRDRLYLEFRERLGRFRVLDPACGSGNFLYLALTHLKDFDLAVTKEAAQLGLTPDRIQQRVTAETVMGIEINPYAAELARVTVWIGELQWQYRNFLDVKRRPVLGKLDGIVCKDALIDSQGRETNWPAADAIIGNPPFLGDKMMIGQLGEEYVTRLRKTFEGRVPGGADLVCYWFEKARAQIEACTTQYAGLVSTNSIRGGRNRVVLDRIVETGAIYDAWSDEAWVLDGAAVRVSLVCFGRTAFESPRLNGYELSDIPSNLDGGPDLKGVATLDENKRASFIGTQKGGPFEIPGDIARRWINEPKNPNGRGNQDVIFPWVNGEDLTRRSADYWIVDFGTEITSEEAALFEKPFDHVTTNVKPRREGLRREGHAKYWWRHAEARPGMRSALATCRRFIVTPRVAKHRVFVWKHNSVLPDSATVAIARDDDTTFGILHSRFHEQWSLRLGTSLEDRPRYTPSTTFETFPFPKGLTPNIPAKDYENDSRAQRIAAAARRLNELRENWLNPPDLVRRVPEVVPGYPDRILPVSEAAAAELKKRTLTNLYNQRPQWLDNAHRDLDAAVAAAYGWPEDISDDDALKKLFELNQDRAKSQKAGK